MLKKRILLCFLLTLSLLCADYTDSDMDGVPDAEDRCPNSALTDIVDATGCVIEKVVFQKEHHFDISLGFMYSKVDANSSQSAQSLSVGYYYGNFSAYVYTSNFDLQNGESGIDDTTVGLYYRDTLEQFAWKIGAGGYIPTYDGSGNRTDYFISARTVWYLGNADLYINVQHTFMQDSDTEDTNRLTLGGGYILTPKSYLSLSYTAQNSIYAGEEDLRNLALYADYTINKHWFLSTELSLGLSDSATEHAFFVSLGYYF